MCTVNGITASILFDRPFSGLIYSLGYERVHECLYYNSVLTESVLFSVPMIGCGTKKSYNSHEVNTFKLESLNLIRSDAGNPRKPSLCTNG